MARRACQQIFCALAEKCEKNAFLATRCTVQGTSVNLRHLDSSLGVLRVSTSVDYLQDRLRRAGRDDLLEAIARRQISTYHAAEIAGIVKRRPTLGLRDHAAKRLAYAARGLR